MVRNISMCENHLSAPGDTHSRENGCLRRAHQATFSTVREALLGPGLHSRRPHEVGTVRPHTEATSRSARTWVHRSKSLECSDGASRQGRRILDARGDYPSHSQIGSVQGDPSTSVLPREARGSGRGFGHQPGAKRQKKRKTREAEDKSKHDGKVFTHNRRGMEICANWNQNRCGKTDRPQSMCERHRSHQCNRCLGPHQGLSCTKAK